MESAVAETHQSCASALSVAMAALQSTAASEAGDAVASVRAAVQAAVPGVREEKTTSAFGDAMARSQIRTQPEYARVPVHARAALLAACALGSLARDDPQLRATAGAVSGALGLLAAEHSVAQTKSAATPALLWRCALSNAGVLKLACVL